MYCHAEACTLSGARSTLSGATRS